MYRVQIETFVGHSLGFRTHKQFKQCTEGECARYVVTQTAIRIQSCSLFTILLLIRIWSINSVRDEQARSVWCRNMP